MRSLATIEWEPLHPLDGELLAWMDYKIATVCATFGMSREHLGIDVEPNPLSRFEAVALEVFE